LSTGAGVEVRAARPDDYEQVADMTVAAYRALPGQRLSPRYERKLRDVAQRATAATVLVAVEHGRVVGAVTYVPDASSPYAEHLRPDEAGIRMLAVDPPAQRRGVGRALMQACIERARVAGRRRVVLHSTAWMSAAHTLYRSLGFVTAPDRDWKPEPGVELLGFVLELGPGDPTVDGASA
jgi:GNAT superfamily N-acetyltransferase